MSGLPFIVQMTSPVWTASPSISKVWIVFIAFYYTGNLWNCCAGIGYFFNSHLSKFKMTVNSAETKIELVTGK